MKKSLASAVVAIVALLGAGGIPVGPTPPEPANDAGPLEALLDPVTIARQLCSSETKDGYASRRAPFLRMARAYAAELPASHGDFPPLWNGLGSLHIPISTDNPEAQKYFDQGMRIANDFNHSEAIRSFRRAQEIDPDCAMCYWGEALALGPNINAPMAADAAPPAFAAARKALSLANGVSARERALIEALQTRYAADGLQRRAELDSAYASAMEALARRYPADDDMQALAAEALMDAQPWDYWEADLRTPKGRTADILEMLETVMARNPDHAASIHLYIHITEASNDPYRAEAGADRLGSLAPAAPHLVHMPSHTYHRVGRYVDAYRVNQAAVKAGEAYFATANASPLYEYGYHTHNIHSALTSAQMSGDREASLALAEKLDQKMPADMVRLAPWIQAIKVAPYFANVQFGNSDAILAAEQPDADLPYLRTMWHYARGEVMARRGDRQAALEEAAAAEALASHPGMVALDANGLPASTLALIAAEIVRARVEMRQGELGSAITRLENAAAQQDAMFYSEPAYWYFPVRQMLGAALLMDRQAHRAEAVFIRALVDAPNNAWALYGLREAQAAMGNKAAERYADTLFQQAWTGDADTLELEAL